MTTGDLFGLWVANGACLAIGFVLGLAVGMYGTVRWVSISHHAVHPASGLVLPDESNGIVQAPSLPEISQLGAGK